MCITRLVNSICNYYNQRIQLEECLKQDVNQEMFRQKLYYNLTHNYGIYLLN
jgi:hypothetical protein